MKRIGLSLLIFLISFIIVAVSNIGIYYLMGNSGPGCGNEYVCTSKALYTLSIILILSIVLTVIVVKNVLKRKN